MSVNAKIIDSIKGIEKAYELIGKELGITRQGVSQKVKSSKEVDSIKLLVAVSKVTKKPLSYFLDAEIREGRNCNEIEKELKIARNELAELRTENSKLKDKLLNHKDELIKYKDKYFTTMIDKLMKKINDKS